MDIRPQSEALLLKLLSASGQRSKAIANNIANQNTPGYRRQVVQFESLLEQAMNMGASASDGSLLAIEPTQFEDESTPGRSDGNNVNLELEIYASRENRILAETYRTMLQSHYRMLDIAMGSGN